MGTLYVEEAFVDIITPIDSGTLEVGGSVFPESDSSSRSVANFGDNPRFTSKSIYQNVDTETAIINEGVTLIGVTFVGPVTVTLPDSTDITEIIVVDESGLCSTINTITIQSTNTLGELTISSPYAYIQARNNGVSWISEVKDTIVIPSVVSDPGTVTIVTEDGTAISTSEDGNTVFTVNTDGSTVLAVQDGAINSSTTILADGTEIQATSNWNGTTSSYTINVDGSTVQQDDANNGNSSTFTILADGTTEAIEQSNNGNTSNITVSPDGTITTVISQNNGSSENSVINPDGSSSSTEVASNGKVTITTIGTDLVEIVDIYFPWKSTFTRTTTPPGTSETLSPNPYQV